MRSALRQRTVPLITLPSKNLLILHRPRITFDEFHLQSSWEVELTVAGARFDLHEVRHDDRHGDSGHRQLLVVSLSMDFLECLMRMKLSWFQVQGPRTPRTSRHMPKIEQVR